jgi:NDP-sugar pyrophosphorylase family protein
MLAFHHQHRALATLAVKNRDSSRYLIFDETLNLCGRQSTRDPNKLSFAFSGIHVISPRLLRLMPEEGIYSIIPPYLELAARGEKILAFRADEYYWRDLGKLEDLEAAAEDVRNGVIAL